MTDIAKQTKIANKFSWTSTVEFHSQTLIFMVKSNSFFMVKTHFLGLTISWSIFLGQF